MAKKGLCPWRQIFYTLSRGGRLGKTRRGKGGLTEYVLPRAANESNPALLYSQNIGCHWTEWPSVSFLNEEVPRSFRRSQFKVEET